MARILIAGCGDIGTTLGQNLHTAGHTVWGLKRHPAHLPAAINPLAADLTDPASLTQLPPDLDYVIYSAAAAGFNETYYQAAYVDGVRNLLRALTETNQHPQRLLFTSSTSVYGQSHGEWVDEDTPAHSSGFSGRCIRAGEQLFWDNPWPAVVVRFSGIYGPGRTQLIDSVRQGTAVQPSGAPLYTNRIHRDDCARTLAHLMVAADPKPLYLATDDEPAPLDEILRWLALQLGVSEPPVSNTPPKSGTGENNAAVRLRASKRCRNARLRASGFHFHYPSYREGYAALLNLETPFR